MGYREQLIKSRVQRRKVGAALLLLVFGYGRAHGAAVEPLSAKDVRRAEAEARTPEDHLRLAGYYMAKARQAQADLVEAEEDMQRWASMAGRTKIPNPYWSARARAGMYQSDLQKSLKRAAVHQRLAEGK
jgi:hypothetical protein